MHCPFWQIPLLQGVPNGFDVILPFLHDFLPFFRSHVPFLQISHSPSVRWHFPDFAPAASSSAATPRRPTAPRRVAVRAWRREPAAERERERRSNRSASMLSLQ
jgi:hypothetical protein